MTNPISIILQPDGAMALDTRIAVLCGGFSAEQAVSLRSGAKCLEALHRLGYANAERVELDTCIAETLTEKQIQVVFLVTHGRYGEDGCIQGLLEVLGIPYTGSRLEASAVAMNKRLTKLVLDEAGLPVLPTVCLELNTDNYPALAGTYDGAYPAMVKPLGEGSSVGMSKVHNLGELASALKQAAPYGSQAMVEPFVTGRDLTVGVFQAYNRLPGSTRREPKLTVTPVLELKTKTDWYDEAAKYTPGLTEFILPANVDEATTQHIQETALKAHQLLGCHGVSRTDFVIADDKQFYILETNTLPGMTDLSDLPAQAQAMDVSYDELVFSILHSAVVNVPRGRSCPVVYPQNPSVTV